MISTLFPVVFFSAGGTFTGIVSERCTKSMTFFSIQACLRVIPVNQRDAACCFSKFPYVNSMAVSGYCITVFSVAERGDNDTQFFSLLIIFYLQRAGSVILLYYVSCEITGGALYSQTVRGNFLLSILWAGAINERGVIGDCRSSRVLLSGNNNV